MRVFVFQFLSFLLFFSTNLLAQDANIALNPERKIVHDKPLANLSAIEIAEDSLAYFADSMYFSSMPEDRISGSYAFLQSFKKMIKLNTSFAYNFPKLKEKINILNTPDNAFRVYNWEIMRSETVRRYYGVVQMPDGSFIPLVDVSDQIIRGAEDSVFDGTRWFGCLYYNILKRDVNGQSVYFLLGWNGNGMNSDRKIVEPFGFDEQGKSRFGAPLFNLIERGKRKRAMRFIYEYQKEAKVVLNFDKDADQIVFDHCESQIGDAAKRFTYIPDGSYDALRWDGQKWNMFEDIIQAIDLKQGNVPVEKPIKN
jgi:hypothetical protein